MSRKGFSSWDYWLAEALVRCFRYPEIYGNVNGIKFKINEIVERYT